MASSASEARAVERAPLRIIALAVLLATWCALPDDARAEEVVEAPPAAEIAAPAPAVELATPGPVVYGRLQTYMRLYEDVSPKDRAAKQFRLPVLTTVHVGGYRLGVEGLSAEVLGYGELEAFEPREGPIGRADLLLATVTWRGLPDRMLTVIAGRQLLHVAAANHAILDGLYARVALPAQVILEAWGGWTAEPEFGSDPERWQSGVRLAWDPWDHGHIGLSFHHEHSGDDVARERLGVDFAWRTLPWLQVVGHAFIDSVEMDLEEMLVRADVDVSRDLKVHAEYRRFDPAARIPKTSIFSVFAQTAYDEAGASLGWYPARSDLSVFGSGSLIVYPGGAVGGRVWIRPRLVVDREDGEVVGLELGRVQGPEDGYWDARVFGVWRPADRVSLAFDAEQAFYDEAQNGHSWSTFARASATLDLIAGLHVMGEVSVTLDPRFEQSWLSLVRIGYELSGHPPAREVLR